MRLLIELGLWCDEGLNVETGGDADQTLSLRAALAARRGSKTACVFCRVLSWLVQPRHCAKQLSAETMRPVNYIRGMLCIMAAYGVQVVIAWQVWSILSRL